MVGARGRASRAAAGRGQGRRGRCAGEGEALGTRVAIDHGRGGKGKLVIHYANLDALDGVLEKLRAKG